MILVYRQIWKRIEDYPDYEVSNYGQVKSWKSYNGAIPPRILKPVWRGNKYSKYLDVSLSKVTKKIKRIHHLVLEAFKSKRPDGMEGCHNNGKRWDNSIWNLRWDTPKNNHADKKKHGTTAMGERIGISKLKYSDIPEIKDLRKNNYKYPQIGKMYGVHANTISKICRGLAWKSAAPLNRRLNP